jgi:hypothetical protein
VRNPSTENTLNTTLDLSDLAKGVYYIEATTATDKSVKKIILN